MPRLASIATAACSSPSPAPPTRRISAPRSTRSASSRWRKVGASLGPRVPARRADARDRAAWAGCASCPRTARSPPARRRARGLRARPRRLARHHAASRLRAQSLVYLTYSEPGEGGHGTAAAMARLSADGERLEDVQGDLPPVAQERRAASFRLAHRVRARRAAFSSPRRPRRSRNWRRTSRSHRGQVIRLEADGRYRPTIRSSKDPARCRRSGPTAIATPQGLAMIPATGELYDLEHGPRGGDEVNISCPAATTAGR